MHIFILESTQNFIIEANEAKSMNTCTDVLAGLGRMHGAMAHGWLNCPLWLNDSSASKKLVDGGTEVHNLSRLQRPVI